MQQLIETILIYLLSKKNSERFLLFSREDMEVVIQGIFPFTVSTAE